MNGGQFHGFVDTRGANIQRTAEDEREAQHVVHLIREVRAAGGHDYVRARFAGYVRVNFRVRVRTSEDHRVSGHLFHLLRREQARAREADEHVRTVDGIVQRTHVGIAGKLGFVLVDPIAISVNHTATVQHDQILFLGAARD